MKVQIKTISLALMAVLIMGAGPVMAATDATAELKKMEEMKADEMNKMDGDMQADAKKKMNGMKDDAMEKMDDAQAEMKKKNDMKATTAGN